MNKLWIKKNNTTNENITKLTNLIGEFKCQELLHLYKEIEIGQNPNLKALNEDQFLKWLDKKIDLYSNKKS